jgi:hypothetical protein
MHSRVYVNSVKFLKVGQSLWVDGIFSKAVLNGVYAFHASAAAYKEFWNDSFSCGSAISRHYIWQAFIQESIHTIALESDTNLTLHDGLDTDEVTREAFRVLREDGII